MFRNLRNSDYAVNGKCGEDATDELYNKVRSVSEGKLSPYVWDGSLLHTYGQIIYSCVGIPYLLVNCIRQSQGLETLAG